MEADILERIERIEGKIDQVNESVGKIRKYFFWTFAITAATIVLPLIALVFVAPWALGILANAYGIQ